MSKGAAGATEFFHAYSSIQLAQESIKKEYPEFSEIETRSGPSFHYYKPNNLSDFIIVEPVTLESEDEA